MARASRAVVSAGASSCGTSKSTWLSWPESESTEHTYRLEQRGTRSLGDLGTTVSVAFTFRSAAVDQKTALPVMVVGYPADLGRDNAARPGSTLRLPVRIQRQAGSPDIPVDTLTVEASYDDGATWQPTGVRRGHAGRWSALVHHPRRAGCVSLRATAADADGNQVEQTVIHAYQLRRN